jgi:hypothetical protein
MRISLLIISLFIAHSTLAGVYKSVDEDGNVIFSDQPSPDAEKIKIKEVQTIKAPKVKSKKEALPAEGSAKEGQKPVGYSTLAIIHPQNGTGIRANDGNITITTAVKPALDQEAGHTLALYMDNQLVSSGPGTTFSLKNVERGTHSFSVAVIDKDGKELTRSATISFSVLRK